MFNLNKLIINQENNMSKENKTNFQSFVPKIQLYDKMQPKPSVQLQDKSITRQNQRKTNESNENNNKLTLKDYLRLKSIQKISSSKKKTSQNTNINQSQQNLTKISQKTFNIGINSVTSISLLQEQIKTNLIECKESIDTILDQLNKNKTQQILNEEQAQKQLIFLCSLHHEIKEVIQKNIKKSSKILKSHKKQRDTISNSNIQSYLKNNENKQMFSQQKIKDQEQLNAEDHSKIITTVTNKYRRIRTFSDKIGEKNNKRKQKIQAMIK